MPTLKENIDRTLLDQGRYQGVDWMVAMGSATINGYVVLPEGHPWLGEDLFDAADRGSDVFGGITAAEGNIVGFDTGHAGGAVHPESPLYKENEKLGTTHLISCGKVWELDDVRQETLRLAEQAAAAL